MNNFYREEPNRRWTWIITKNRLSGTSWYSTGLIKVIIKQWLRPSIRIELAREGQKINIRTTELGHTSPGLSLANRLRN